MAGFYPFAARPCLAHCVCRMRVRRRGARARARTSARVTRSENLARAHSALSSSSSLSLSSALGQRLSILVCLPVFAFPLVIRSVSLAQSSVHSRSREEEANRGPGPKLLFRRRARAHRPSFNEIAQRYEIQSNAEGRRRGARAQRLTRAAPRLTFFIPPPPPRAYIP